MPNPPLLLVDNVFDAVGLYPGATVDATSEAAGHEAFRVADYRRDRTYWQAATDIATFRIRTHLTTAVPVDFVFLDRGHNLAGMTVAILGGEDGTTWPDGFNLTVPSAVGGTPAPPTMAQTEEGAAWSVFTALPAHHWWAIQFTTVVGGLFPLITGLMLGMRTQLVNFGKTFDEDAGGRTQPSQQSTAGYRGNDPTYAWRTVTLDLDLIGGTEYDSSMRSLRAKLFEKNQPFVCAMDYGTHPERAWMYTYDGTTWGMPKSKVYRAGRIVGREHMPRLT
jgi:hypothetical protein